MYRKDVLHHLQQILLNLLLKIIYKSKISSNFRFQDMICLKHTCSQYLVLVVRYTKFVAIHHKYHHRRPQSYQLPQIAVVVVSLWKKRRLKYSTYTVAVQSITTTWKQIVHQKPDRFACKQILSPQAIKWYFHLQNVNLERAVGLTWYKKCSAIRCRICGSNYLVRRRDFHCVRRVPINRVFF